MYHQRNTKFHYTTYKQSTVKVYNRIVFLHSLCYAGSKSARKYPDPYFNANGKFELTLQSLSLVQEEKGVDS